MPSVVVLTAGKSSRMGGRPKALLPFGGETLLGHVVSCFPGCTAIAVVREGAVEIEREARRIGALVAVNAAPERGQSSSVLEGLRRAARGEPAFVTPVDVPLRDASTAAALLAAIGDAAAAVPVWQGNQGHPVLLSAPAWEGLLAPEGSVWTLRSVLANLGPRAVRVDVADPGVAGNMNTPEDCERWRREFQS